MTEIFGTVASATANSSLAPWRMMPWRSTWLPIMKPGTSARNSSGMLKALQSQTNRAPLSAESPKSTPPLTFGWLATIPSTRPSRRARPVISSGAKSRLTSKKLPSSTRRSTTLYMSKTRFCATGTSSSIGRPGAGSRAAAAGGASCQERGMYSSQRATRASASSSVAASTSPRPLTVQCMRAPPMSSIVTFSPVAISDMRGEPRYAEAWPSTMITRSQNAGMYAAPAGEGPSSTHTCGTTPESWIWLWKMRPAWWRPTKMSNCSSRRAPAESTRYSIGTWASRATSWMRWIFWIVRRPQAPAFTVMSLAITATGRPPIVPVSVTTASAGRPSSAARASRPSSTIEPGSRSRASRSRTKSLPSSRSFWWYFSWPPRRMASMRWSRSGSSDTHDLLGVGVERVPVVGALAEPDVEPLDAGLPIGGDQLGGPGGRAAQEAGARVAAEVRLVDRLAARGALVLPLLGADVGPVPAVGPARRRPQRPLLAPSADPEGQPPAQGLGVVARVVELEVLAGELRHLLVGVEELPQHLCVLLH